MDNIDYPRALNRPTYIVWRFTHTDVLAILIVFIAGFMPKVFVDSFPDSVTLGAPLLFTLYKGLVVALKPRGWDSHVVHGWLSPKKLNPGHSFSRCVIVERIKGPRKVPGLFKMNTGHTK